MRRVTLNLVLITIFIFFISCGTARQEKTQDQSSGAEPKTVNLDKQPPIMGETIAPNKCRIIGTVVAIDSTLRSSDPTNPCSKVPCRAIVRVDSILGYGPAFLKPLSEGEKIPVTFVFTTGPTKNLFPNMTQSYPGVRAGSKILADLEAQERLRADNANSISFVIYGYKIK